MKTTESLNASIGRILDENFKSDIIRNLIDVSRFIEAKMKVVREIVELIESHDAELANMTIKDELIEKLKNKKDELIDWLETECQSPETVDLSHSFAENLMIKLAEISYIESELSVLEKELLEDKCHKIYDLVKKANTPGTRSFEEAEEKSAEQKEELLGDRYFKRVQKESALSAEKIFNKFCTLININYGEYIIQDKKGFLKAMEKYRQTGIREELAKDNFIKCPCCGEWINAKK